MYVMKYIAACALITFLTACDIPGEEDYEEEPERNVLSLPDLVTGNFTEVSRKVHINFTGEEAESGYFGLEASIEIHFGGLVTPPHTGTYERLGESRDINVHVDEPWFYDIVPPDFQETYNSLFGEAIALYQSPLILDEYSPLHPYCTLPEQHNMLEQYIQDGHDSLTLRQEDNRKVIAFFRTEIIDIYLFEFCEEWGEVYGNPNNDS